MKFKINNDLWEIKEIDKETLIKEYKKDTDEDVKYLFGMTKYPEHEIWINKDMCEEQKIKTLKHELTHCFIWEYGLGQVPHFTEEMVCDLVSSIHDFIEEILRGDDNGGR